MRSPVPEDNVGDNETRIILAQYERQIVICESSIDSPPPEKNASVYSSWFIGVDILGYLGALS